MKKLQLITLLMVLLFILSACQPTATEAPAVDQPSAIEYPAPEEVAPLVEAAASALSASSVYPDITDGAVIDWPHLEAFAHNGEVARIVQGESASVTVTLKDGRTFLISVPQPEYVEALLQSCGEICKQIEVVNE